MERTEGIEPISVCLEGSCATIALSPLITSLLWAGLDTGLGWFGFRKPFDAPSSPRG